MSIENITEFHDQYPSDPALVAIAIAYRNTGLIGREIFPIVPVPSPQFKYTRFPKGQDITLPSTAVGPKGEPNEIETSGEEVPGTTKAYGLQERIAQRTVDAANDQFNPQGRAVERITNLVYLDAEVRIAKVATDLNNFASGHRDTLSGSTQFSHADSDPIGYIEEKLNVPFFRPNHMVIGQQAWSVLRQHPDIIKSVNRNSGDKGLASRREVADLFELDDIFVGRAHVNTSKKKGEVTTARAWGKDMLLFYRDLNADTQNGVTFGFAPRYGGWVAKSIPGPMIGLHGGVVVIAGEEVDEVITAPDLGFLCKNIIA